MNQGAELHLDRRVVSRDVILGDLSGQEYTNDNLYKIYCNGSAKYCWVVVEPNIHGCHCNLGS
jgi:hypothetical protein